MKAPEIPLYLRFDVKLSYMAPNEGTIVERLEWVQMILQPFKKALIGSKFEFLGKIGERYFKDSSSLLDHIDKTLQIADRCRVYKFYIKSYINENSSTNTLAAILKFDAIVRCSKIGVEFDFWNLLPRHLPIGAIGNWLNLNNVNRQEDNERFMKLKIYGEVPNLGEMFEYLKEVYYFFLKLLHYIISAPKKDLTH